MVPGDGFEPPTFGLQNHCTTAVLTGPLNLCARHLFSILHDGLCKIPVYFPKRTIYKPPEKFFKKNYHSGHREAFKILINLC